MRTTALVAILSICIAAAPPASAFVVCPGTAFEFEYARDSYTYLGNGAIQFADGRIGTVDKYGNLLTAGDVTYKPHSNEVPPKGRYTMGKKWSLKWSKIVGGELNLEVEQVCELYKLEDKEGGGITFKGAFKFRCISNWNNLAKATKTRTFTTFWIAPDKNGYPIRLSRVDHALNPDGSTGESLGRSRLVSLTGLCDK